MINKDLSRRNELKKSAMMIGLVILGIVLTNSKEMWGTPDIVMYTGAGIIWAVFVLMVADLAAKFMLIRKLRKEINSRKNDPGPKPS